VFELIARCSKRESPAPGEWIGNRQRQRLLESTSGPRRFAAAAALRRPWKRYGRSGDFRRAAAQAEQIARKSSAATIPTLVSEAIGILRGDDAADGSALFE